MLDYGALPPEINSARIYAGPGAGSMLAAATAWQDLAAELNSAAANYTSVIAGLTSGPWRGPTSVAMASAVAPYMTWLSATGAQAEEAAARAAAAASAYETALAATVPPSVIAANRSLLATLVATNLLGQNTPAIAATEFHYAEMWAQDAAAMYGYAGASAGATKVAPFTMPPQVTDSTGLAHQAETLMSAGPQLISVTPQTLQGLAAPQVLDTVTSTSGSSSGTSGLSSLSSLSMLTMPARMAMMPMSMLMRMFMMGGTNTAAKAATAGAAAAGGLSSAAGAAGSANLVTLSGSTSAVSAGMGRAASAGALSVPSGWAGGAPSMSAATAALPATAAGAAPAAQAGTAMPPMMPVANMAGRAAVGGDTPRFELRPSVIPRFPAGG